MDPKHNDLMKLLEGHIVVTLLKICDKETSKSSQRESKQYTHRNKAKNNRLFI